MAAKTKQKSPRCVRCGKPGPVGVCSRQCKACCDDDLRSLERQFGMKPGELDEVDE